MFVVQRSGFRALFVEKGVNSMKKEEASFSEYSIFLQSWDDKQTIYRSKLVKFVVDLPKEEKIKWERKTENVSNRQISIRRKLKRKYEAVYESIVSCGQRSRGLEKYCFVFWKMFLR